MIFSILPHTSELINNSLTRFRIPEVVRIEKLKDGLNIVELFHGTTLAFKDLGLEVVCALLNHFLTRSGRHVTVLVGRKTLLLNYHDFLFFYNGSNLNKFGLTTWQELKPSSPVILHVYVCVCVILWEGKANSHVFPWVFMVCVCKPTL